MTIAESNAPVPANILRVIQAKGFTKMSVAKQSGLTQQQLSDMLNGRKLIRPCDVVTIAKTLGVRPGSLFAEVRSTT